MTQMSSMLLACGVDKPENEERSAHITIYWRATCGFVSDKIFSVCHSDFVSTRKFTGDGKMKWLVNADKQYITFTSCTLCCVNVSRCHLAASRIYDASCSSTSYTDAVSPCSAPFYICISFGASPFSRVTVQVSWGNAVMISTSDC